jgi:DNA-binding transcriptional LysR family regulator
MNQVDFNHDALRRLDLNLLVAFDVLMQERHVSRAAARLFLGQPAMSHALARLRQLLDDPLFVRSGHQMEPTPRARELAPQVRAWLEQAQQFLFRAEAFDPAAAHATFRLAAPDGMEALLYPALIATLRRDAPGVRLRSQLLETDQQLAALDHDEVDLLITAAPLALRDWHSQLRLFESDFISVHSRRQLQLPEPATLADLASCDHVVSSYRGTAAGVVDHLFAAHGVQRRVLVLSASLLAISHIVAQAPLMSIQPAIYRGLFSTTPDLACAPLPGEARITVGLVWHRRNDRHPLHRYLRDTVIAAMRRQFAATEGVTRHADSAWETTRQE